MLVAYCTLQTVNCNFLENVILVKCTVSLTMSVSTCAGLAVLVVSGCSSCHDFVSLPCVSVVMLSHVMVISSTSRAVTVVMTSCRCLVSVSLCCHTSWSSHLHHVQLPFTASSPITRTCHKRKVMKTGNAVVICAVIFVWSVIPVLMQSEK